MSRSCAKVVDRVNSAANVVNSLFIVWFCFDCSLLWLVSGSGQLSSRKSMRVVRSAILMLES